MGGPGPPVPVAPIGQGQSPVVVVPPPSIDHGVGPPNQGWTVWNNTLSSGPRLSKCQQGRALAFKNDHQSSSCVVSLRWCVDISVCLHVCVHVVATFANACKTGMVEFIVCWWRQLFSFFFFFPEGGTSSAPFVAVHPGPTSPFCVLLGGPNSPCQWHHVHVLESGRYEGWFKLSKHVWNPSGAGFF